VHHTHFYVSARWCAGAPLQVASSLRACKQRVCAAAQVFGLGFTSVFEQVLEGLPEADKNAIFASYIGALDEDPAQYKQVRGARRVVTLQCALMWRSHQAHAYYRKGQGLHMGTGDTAAHSRGPLERVGAPG